MTLSSPDASQNISPELKDTSSGQSRYLGETLRQLVEPQAEPPPKPFRDALKSYLSWAKSELRDVNLQLSQATMVMVNPLTLVTAIPLVENLRINRALSTLSQVPEGRELVGLLKAANIPVRMEGDLLHKDAVFFSNLTASENGRLRALPMQIVVPPYSNHGRLVGHLAHELRHLQQAMNDVLYLGSSKQVSPVENLWYNRAIEADASATAVDISYKLHQAGHSDAWREINRSRTWPTSIAKAYETAVKRDPAALANGNAKRAAYDSWFDAKASLGDKLTQIYTSQGLTMHRVEANLHRENLRAPMRHLTADDIKKLGAMSGGVNYLDTPGQRPLDDLHYRRNNFSKHEAALIAAEHISYQSKFFDRDNPARKSALEAAQSLIKSGDRGFGQAKPSAAGPSAEPPAVSMKAKTPAMRAPSASR